MFNPNHPGSVCREAPFARFRYQTPQVACQRRGGFTMIEMMVVVLIIAILAGITAVAVNSAKEKARQTDCMSNLRQLGTAIVTYRADNRGRNPPWLSKLYPTYIDDTRIFICRSDKFKGRGDCRPADVPGRGFGVNYDESVLNDYGSSSSDGKNTDVKANSYMYEFSAAMCPWKVDGQPATWNAWKENQLAKGDQNNGATADHPIPYSSSRMPIVRCYHHTRHGKIKARDDRGNLGPKPITLNVAYAGNVIISPLWWEGALEPGEE
jgi:prepilin-type N-terminal cleavage/methylation domain-containing protein